MSLVWPGPLPAATDTTDASDGRTPDGSTRATTTGATTVTLDAAATPPPRAELRRS